MYSSNTPYDWAGCCEELPESHWKPSHARRIGGIHHLHHNIGCCLVCTCQRKSNKNISWLLKRSENTWSCSCSSASPWHSIWCASACRSQEDLAQIKLIYTLRITVCFALLTQNGTWYKKKSKSYNFLKHVLDKCSARPPVIAGWERHNSDFCTNKHAPSHTLWD